MDSSSGSIKRKLDDRQPPGQSHVSSNASHTPEGARSNFDQIHESPTACASPRQITNAMGPKKRREDEEAGNDSRGQHDFGYASGADKMSLQAIAGGSVDKIFAKMQSLTPASEEKVKRELGVILEGNGASQKREYLMLQKLVQSRTDLTTTTLSHAHRLQLEILVAIKTGNHALLQDRTSFILSKSGLIDIFEQRRCSNVKECEASLPAKNCVCRTCTDKKGFCNICMCIICNKYVLKGNDCESCDICSHKFHRDCAMGNELIGKRKAHPSKMVFRCQDCTELIDLMIKSVDKAIDRKALMNDFDIFSGILRGKDNPGQKELFSKCEDLKEKMKNDTGSSLINEILFFQELSMDAPKSLENGEGGKLIAPQEASNQITEVEMKFIRDKLCSEGALGLEKEEEEEEEEHATPETDVIGGKTSGQTEDVQPLEQPQQLVDADGAQPEPATRDAGPPSPNASSNLRSSTLLRKFPLVPSDVHLLNVPNMDFPDLSFHGTYSSSNDTMRATSLDQPQILAKFFHTHPNVRTRIERFSEDFRNSFSKRLATLLHTLQSVKMRDFDEAARAEVQKAWTDLTTAGFELQDLEPVVAQALHADIKEREEKLTTTILALERDRQALRDKLDKPPL